MMERSESVESLFDGIDEEFLSESEEVAIASGSKRLCKVPLGSCSDCQRTYYSLQGYKSHLEIHAFYDLLTNAPSFEDLLPELEKRAMKLLVEVGSSRVLCGEVGAGPEIRNLITTLQLSSSQKFIVAAVQEVYKCLPKRTLISTAEFHRSFVRNVIALQGSRQYLLEILGSVAPCRPQVAHIFMCDFINKLSISVEACFLHCLWEPLFSSGEEKIKVAPRDNPENPEFQQSVHYIGGATVKSLASKAICTKTKSWKNILSCLSTKFFIAKGEDPIEFVSQWTRSVDRGGLKFISPDVWVFFMALTDILKQAETKYGSLPHSVVNSMCKSEPCISLLWDEIVGSDLNKEENELLFQGLVTSFSNTWGRGIALRRKKIHKLGDNTALRSALSR